MTRDEAAAAVNEAMRTVGVLPRTPRGTQIQTLAENKVLAGMDAAAAVRAASQEV